MRRQKKYESDYERLKRPIRCDICNINVRYNNMPRHRKSKAHKFMLSLQEMLKII